MYLGKGLGLGLAWVLGVAGAAGAVACVSSGAWAGEADQQYQCEVTVEFYTNTNPHHIGHNHFEVKGATLEEARANAQARCAGDSECSVGDCGAAVPVPPLPTDSREPTADDLLTCAGADGIELEVLRGKSIYGATAVIRGPQGYVGTVPLEATVPGDQTRPIGFVSVLPSMSLELTPELAGRPAHLDFSAFGVEAHEEMACRWYVAPPQPVSPHGSRCAGLPCWVGGHH